MQKQFQPLGWLPFGYVPLPPVSNLPLPCPPVFVDDNDLSITTTVGPPGLPGSLIVPVKIIGVDYYEPTEEDYYIGIDVNSSSNIVLPSASTRRCFIIKDLSGNAITNNITITAATTIDGQGSYVLDSNYGSITLVFNGVEWSVV